jgi:hypothetical protein
MSTAIINCVFNSPAEPLAMDKNLNFFLSVCRSHPSEILLGTDSAIFAI